jgi:benzoate membrane transport protein
LVWGGLISIATAGMLGSGTNSAAITAAIGSGEQAEPDKTRRYSAGVVCGIFYLIVGILGATMLGLFGALPGAMLAALAGLGLLPAIANSTHDALEDPQYREAALITFLVTVSNIHPLKLGSPFWGLVAGFIVHYIVEFKGRKK